MTHITHMHTYHTHNALMHTHHTHMRVGGHEPQGGMGYIYTYKYTEGKIEVLTTGVTDDIV